MRKVVWLVAAGLGLMLAGSFVAPAQAAGGPTGGISSPTDKAILSQPTVHVTAQFQQADGNPAPGPQGTVTDVAISIVAMAGQTLPDDASTNQGFGTATANVDWTSPVLAANGPYEVHVTATGDDGFGGGGTNDSTRGFSLNVPPATPKGVKATFDQQTNSVTVTWTPNTEPDLVGYQVQRQADGQNLEEAGQTAKATFTDTVGQGQWKYRVVAVRSGATADELLASDPSATSTVTVTPPPTTTTSPAGGTSSTSGGSGNPPGSDGSGATSGTGTTAAPGSSSSNNQAIAKSGTINMSDFAALLDSARNRPPVKFEPPDPGFQQTLPFQPGQTAAAGGDDLGTKAELGPADTGLESRIIVDHRGRRRQAMSYVAGGLLLFVLMMHIVWIKAEVDRTPLDVLTPADGDTLPAT